MTEGTSAVQTFDSSGKEQHLLVIGGTSLDLLHLGGRRIRSAGGAGMYTAMAAWRCGIRVSLFAPRPVPVPARLRPVAARLSRWLGPAVRPEELPRFEISHEGGQTTYIDAFFGAESTLNPDSLPEDLSGYDLVHVVPLGDGHRQQEFIRRSRARGAARVSAGTYLQAVVTAPSAVRRIIEETDIFFLNRDEAVALFGSVQSARTGAGKLLFVTLGSAGVRVIQGECASDLPSVPADERDPTGAGDSFCGAALAALIRGQHPVMAARAAAPLAAAVVRRIGPKALFSNGPPPAVPVEDGVVIDEHRVKEIARLLAGLEDASAFSFVGPGLPVVNDPRAVDFFFAATLQQFGFWSSRDGRYRVPLIAPLDGASLKGSAYLFAAFLRRLERDEEFCSPARQAAMSREQLLAIFRADDGSDPMPALDLHLEQARQYGRDMLALGLSPEALLSRARASAQPLRTLLAHLDHIGGYKEDPLRKKSGLLALILNQRPERFLPFGEGEEVAPVIDYHLMRSCLRMGLIEVRDDELKRALAARRIVEARQEWTVRYAAYRAIRKVIQASGKSCGAVDWFFFDARRRCPEMHPPDCRRCPADPACAHRTELFQPVCRTVFY